MSRVPGNTQQRQETIGPAEWHWPDARNLIMSSDTNLPSNCRSEKEINPDTRNTLSSKGQNGKEKKKSLNFGCQKGVEVIFKIIELIKVVFV